MHNIFDSHCHLDDKAFDQDRNQIIAAFEEDGLRFVLNPGADLGSSQRALGLAQAHPQIYAALGNHPHDCDQVTPDLIETYRLLAQDPKVVAIGEIGLDYYYVKDNKEVQKRAFVMQMDLAEDLNLPVIIHMREATRDTLDILKKYEGRVKGVLHCFSEAVEVGKEAVALGYKLALGGVVTFKNARKTLEVAKWIDLEDLLVETDAPYLAPHPFRGKRNQPAYTRYVIEQIADIKGLAPQDLADITCKNAKILFGIPERVDQ